MEGKVKWFNAEKHIGFIRGEDDKEYFVHLSALKEGFVPRQGTRVEFTPDKNERGLRAVDVKPME